MRKRQACSIGGKIAFIVLMIGCCVVQIAPAGEYPVMVASGDTQRVERTSFQQTKYNSVNDRWTPFQFGVWPEAPDIQLVPCDWNVYGLGMGLATLNRGVYGIQICGACGAGPMQGIQLGILSGAGEMRGIQVGGLMNYTENITGVQVGGFQYSENMQGLQVGLLNICTKTMVGVQIGIINYAKNAVGVQIGLGNVIEHSAVQRLPIINVHF